MPKNLPPEVQAIVSSLDAGFFATAARLLEPYLQANPNSTKGWIDFGQALGQLGRYDEAEAALQKAIAVTEEGSDGILGAIGHLYRARGDFESAMIWYQKQIDAAPQDATGYLYLSNIQINQGHTELAIATLRKAEACDEGCQEEVLYSLGLALRNAGQLDAAKIELEKAVALDAKFEAAKVLLKDVTKAKSL